MTAPRIAETAGPGGSDDAAPLAQEALALVRLPVWVFDIDRRRVHWANDAALAVWRAASLDELRARDMGRDMSVSVATRLAQFQADFERHDARFNEQWTLYPGGQPVSLQVHYRGVRLPDGRMAMLCQGEHLSGSSPESLRSVEALLHTPMMIGLHTLDGHPLWRNPAARASVRDARESLAARFVDAGAWQRLREEVRQSGQVTLTMEVHTTDGRRWHEVSARLRRDAVTGEAALLISETDVTPLKQSEARALYLSDHDVLTGLPNRGHAQHAFDAFARRVRQSTGPQPLQAAVVIIDLDRFKDVNDSWGHVAGDALLVQVAARLRSVVRRSDIVARFGGDEFLVLLCSTDVRAEIGRIYPRIRQALGTPFELVDRTVAVSATLGASVCPDDGADFDTLLQHADLALYQAKSAGRDSLAFYQAGLSERLRARTQLEAALRRALAGREFVLAYQPRLGVDGDRIVGAEALVRWCPPDRDPVMPAEFIPLLESLGLMRELGRQVLEMAARQQAAWRTAGLHVQLSVNLSPSEFTDDGLLADLQDTLDRTGCPPEALELEITESMLIGDDDRPLRTLDALRALGLSIALDDFGTGYSNLAYLQRFPFSTVKIDRRFVQAPASERPLTEAIVGLCRALRLHPVAEGVETEAQHAWLRAMNVDEFQGFLFARPMPAQAFEQRLAAGRGAVPPPAVH